MTREATVKVVAEEIIERGRKHATGEPLFFDRLNLEAAITAGLVRDAAAGETHRCSGCGHRWEGELSGAELCGDCWRKAQPMLHAAGETREEEKIARACSCQEPDPVMQADGRFYCYTCSFQTGARPRSLEPEDAWRLRDRLTALKRYTVVSDTPSDYADPNGPYVRYADLLNALRE